MKQNAKGDSKEQLDVHIFVSFSFWFCYHLFCDVFVLIVIWWRIHHPYIFLNALLSLDEKYFQLTIHFFCQWLRSSLSSRLFQLIFKYKIRNRFHYFTVLLTVRGSWNFGKTLLSRKSQKSFTESVNFMQLINCSSFSSHLRRKTELAGFQPPES